MGRIRSHVWIARNNDIFVPDNWGYATTREVIGRIPNLCFGQEGDVFTATGINRDRLWLHHQALVVSDAVRPRRPHLPSWVLMTEMLETCSTIADVEARLAAVDRDEDMLLFAVDGKTDEFAIIECGRSRHARRARPAPFSPSRTMRVSWTSRYPMGTHGRARHGSRCSRPTCTGASPSRVSRRT